MSLGGTRALWAVQLRGVILDLYDVVLHVLDHVGDGVLLGKFNLLLGERRDGQAVHTVRIVDRGVGH